MTIVRLTTIHPNPGVKWEDVQKQIKKACDLARKHGAENVTVTVTMIGGRATNTIGVTSSAEDWTRFGQVQQASWTILKCRPSCLRVARSPVGVVC